MKHKIIDVTINFNTPEICCVCGKRATYKHMSIIGQIPFFVCKKHYKETSPAFGFDENVKSEYNPLGRKMGLFDKNRKWVNLKFYNKSK